MFDLLLYLYSIAQGNGWCFFFVQ